MKPVVRIERADSDELFRAKVNQNFLTVAKDAAQNTDSLAVAAISNGVTNGDGHDHDGGDGAAIPPEGLKYYMTSSSSSGYSGQYTRLATVSLKVRYAEYTQELAVIGGDGGTPLRGCHVRWRVRQQNDMGGAPIVEIVVRDRRGIAPGQFVAVTTTNSSSETVVSLYFQPSTTYQYVVFRPLVRYLRDSATQVWWYDNQGFSASLPSGTQTTGHDGMSHVVANRASSQTIDSATVTIVVMNTEITDALGEYSTTTGLFKAAETGVYALSAHVVLDSTAWAVNNMVRTAIEINGGTNGQFHAYKYMDVAATHYESAEWRVPAITLEAGDTLGLQLYHNRAGGSCSLYASSMMNWLRIDRIS